MSKKGIWIVSLLCAVLCALAIGFYISKQAELTAPKDDSTSVREDAIRVLPSSISSNEPTSAATGTSGELRDTGAAPGQAGQRSATQAAQGQPEQEDDIKALAAAADRAASAGPAGRVDTADIKEAITRVKPLVKQCYDELLDDFPQASGEMTVQMKITATEGIGEVEAVEVGEDSTLFDQRMSACMGRALSLVTFPIEGDSEGGSVVVTYPFVFRTQ